MISFGAGVNSVAMSILLIDEGWHGAVVFADTGCEWPETYEYMDYFNREFIKKKGLDDIVILGSEFRGTVPSRDSRTLIEFCEYYRVTPMGRSRWCTVGWKHEILAMYAKVNDISVTHVGIASDESRRCRSLSYPLVERGITRAGCVDIISNAGLVVPSKSGCYICPFQSRARTIELYRKHPDLFERAARLEESSNQRRDGKRSTIVCNNRYTYRDIEKKLSQQMTIDCLE